MNVSGAVDDGGLDSGALVETDRSRWTWDAFWR